MRAVDRVLTALLAATIAIAGAAPASGQTVVLQESFSTWPPAGWTFATAGCGGWSSANPSVYPNYTGGSGAFAASSGDQCSGAVDASMTTPGFSLPGGATQATLTFRQDFYPAADTSDTGEVDISSDGGGTWTPLVTQVGVPSRGPAVVSADLTSYIGSGGLLVRFHFTTGGPNWWWQIDDVNVAALTCTSPPAPQIAGGSSGCAVPGAVLSTGAYAAYQWQQGGADIAGANQQTFSASESGTYSVRVADTSGCSGTSQPFPVTVNPSATAPGVAVSGGGCSSSSALLTATGGGPFSSYRWTHGGQIIPGETGAGYTASQTGWYAVQGVTADGCSAASAGTYVVVENPSPVISGAATGCGGVALSAPPFATYAWNLEGQPIPGATSQTYNAVTSGDYTVTGTTAEGCGATSPPKSVAVAAALDIAAQPQGQVVPPGQTMTFSVTMSGAGPFTYQWYQGGSGDVSQPVAGAIGPSYTTPPVSANSRYWVRVWGGGCSADSTTANALVCAAAILTGQPQSRTISSGQTATLTVGAEAASAGTVRASSLSSPLMYQWYVGQSGDTSGPISGADAPSYTTPPLTSTTSYWASATNGCTTTDSLTATITVSSSVSFTSPDHVTFTAGAFGSFTVTTAGTPPVDSITLNGALPGGVGFVDNGNGTGTLSGTPAGPGTYPLVFTAANGVGAPVQQTFTLEVDPASIPALGGIGIVILLLSLAVAGALLARRA